jgi:Ca2+-binding RTX toxin-like protein
MGAAGNDTLDGGTGGDSLLGGSGNDTYVVDDVNDVIVESTTSTIEIDTVRASLNWTLGDNLENLVLTGTSNFNGTGNSLNNTITGNAGNNVLNGGSGADVMLGGSGNDTYIVDNAKDLVIETIDARSRLDAGGIDTVESSLNYTLPTFVENLTLRGTDNLVGNGNALANVISGNSGANILLGGTGADTLDGANGADIYLISLASEHLAGEVIADTGNGVGDVDEIRFASTTAGTLVLQDSITGIERVVIGTGVGSTAITAGRVALGVDASAVTGPLEMLGNAGNNTLIGTVGADTIDGGLGSDRLTGGAGADHFKFSSALGAANIDTITDFVVGQDKLVLDSRVFTAFAGAQSVSNSNLKVGQAGVQATEVGEFLVFDAESKKLYYDGNGSGTGGLLQFATLTSDGNLNLSASDFLII